MAIDWAPITQTAIGAIAAIGGGAVGAWLQGRQQQRAARENRRERAGEVLAEVTALLEDADPGSLALDASPDSYNGVLVRLSERRRSMRVQLLTLATAHPSQQVRDLARRLEWALVKSLRTTGLYLDELVSRGGHTSAESREDAQHQHAAAQQLLSELLDAVQRS